MSTVTSHQTPSPYGGLLIPVLLVVLALLASAAVVNAVAKDPVTPGESVESKAEQTVSDSWITATVKSEILAIDASKVLKVRVKTRNGIVFLKGKLPSQAAAALVMAIAEKVKGVRSVDTAGLTIVS